MIGVGSPSAFVYVYGFKGLRLFRCVRYVLHIAFWSSSVTTLSEYHSVVLAPIGLCPASTACEILSSGNVR